MKIRFVPVCFHRLECAAIITACGLMLPATVRAQSTPATQTAPSQQQSGPLRVTGTLIKTFPDRSEAVMKVTTVTPPGGAPVTLNPPRVKLLIFRDGELPDQIADGTPFTAEGKDAGRGRPLHVESVSTNGSDTPGSESGDAAGLTSTPTADADGVVANPVAPSVKSGDPAPPPSQTGGPKPATSSAKACVVHKPAHEPAPKAFVMLEDGTRVEGSRLMTLEATGYGPEDNGEWGDQTFLGTTVGVGTVAVDPRVIPLGKHLWVEGYGFCIALDIGGAIKGKRIDLGQDNEEDAEAVGRVKRRVLVLD